MAPPARAARGPAGRATRAPRAATSCGARGTVARQNVKRTTDADSDAALRGGEMFFEPYSCRGRTEPATAARSHRSPRIAATIADSARRREVAVARARDDRAPGWRCRSAIAARRRRLGAAPGNRRVDLRRPRRAARGSIKSMPVTRSCSGTAARATPSNMPTVSHSERALAVYDRSRKRRRFARTRPSRCRASPRLAPRRPAPAPNAPTAWPRAPHRNVERYTENLGSQARLYRITPAYGRDHRARSTFGELGRHLVERQAARAGAETGLVHRPLHRNGTGRRKERVEERHQDRDEARRRRDVAGAVRVGPSRGTRGEQRCDATPTTPSAPIASDGRKRVIVARPHDEAVGRDRATIVAICFTSPLDSLTPTILRWRRPRARAASRAACWRLVRPGML